MSTISQSTSGLRAPMSARQSARLSIGQIPMAQAGMGLIELMIVILISTFMMAGLLSIVYGTRQNFTAQYQLAQLQDNERLAMTVITNVVQSGGYYYNPTVQTRKNALQVNGNFTAPGQFLFGVAAAGTKSDQIYVRYLVSPGGGTTSDGVMDCTGATNASTVAPQMDVNWIYVDTSVNQLICQDLTTGGPKQPLATGVTGMTINYGLATNGTTSAVQYVSSANMTPADWSLVVSVQVTLNFNTTPAASGANAISMVTASAPTGVSLTRTIDLFNRV